MEPSDCPVNTSSDTAKGEMAVLSPSTQSADKESSSDNRGRSSRRKPMKTHKVAANFEEDDHYDDYLRDGIPDALLEGLGFNEDAGRDDGSDDQSYAGYDMDEDSVHNSSLISTNVSGVRGGQTGGKRRGRPPGRGRGRGTPAQPILMQPSSIPGGSAPTIARRRGRPPKTVVPVRVQPVRAMPPSPNRTPLQPPVKQKQTLNQFRPQFSMAAKPNTSQLVNLSMSGNQLSTTMSSEQSIVASAAALSILPVTEFNVWPVLEKLLAATQSMGMLLGSLKDDLKRTSVMIAASAVGSPGLEHSKKRREVSTKLWRAFVAYKKSFDEIESFTRNTGSSYGSAGGQSPVAGSCGTPPQKLHNVQSPSNLGKKNYTPQSTPNSMQKKQTSQSTPTAQSIQVVQPVKITATSQNTEGQPGSVSRRRPRPVNSNVVIELSDSDEEETNIDEPPVRKQCKLEVGLSSISDSSSPNISQPTPNSEQKKQTSQCSPTEQSNRVTYSNSYWFKGQSEKEQGLESGSTEMPGINELSTTCDEPQKIDSAVTSSSNDSVAEMPDEKYVNKAKTGRKAASPDTKLETDSTDDKIGSHTTDEQQNGVSKLTVSAKEISRTEQTSSPCADVKLEAVSTTAENMPLMNNEPKSSSTTKTELFSSLRFEPLFEIQPLNGSKS